MSNNTKKYISLSKLSTFLDNLKDTFSLASHKHTISDITDYKVDTSLSSTSSNPVANSTLNEEFDAISDAMGALEQAIDGKASSSHTHDDRYYTETEIDTKLSAKADSSHTHTIANVTNLQSALDGKVPTSRTINGKALTANVTLSASDVGAATASHNHNDVYYTQTQLDTKLASKSDTTHNHDSAYDTKGAAASALTEAKSHAETVATNAATKVKNDLLNGAGIAYDTLKELGDLIDENVDAIDALETVAAGKADKTHTHAIADVTNLQVALDTLTENKSDKTHTHPEATQSAAGLMTPTDKIKLDGIEEKATHSIPVVNMSSEDGAVWTATIDNIEELKAGMTFLFVPNRTSSSTTLTLNVNGLGAVAVRRKLSSGTATLSSPVITTQFFANRPVMLMYDTAMPNDTPYWIAMEFTKPSANDLYGYVPVQNGGWYVNANTTDDDLIEAREAFGVYSKSDHNWVQIYDSGATTEQINSFANINISGYKKIMMAIKCVNDTTNASTTRYGSAIFKATNGTTYQFPVFNSMFFGSETTTASIGFFEFIDGWIVCPQVVRSIKYADFLTSTEGGTCTNMNNMGSGLMKCTNTISTVTISSLDQNADFYFGVGSRVIVWGSVI